MSPPTYFDVQYKINPWMHTIGNVNRQIAHQQWQQLFHTITIHTNVITTTPIAYPDTVFTANAGLVLGREVILSSFKFEERQYEEPYWEHIFSTQGYTIHKLKQTTFEGAGDALFAGNTLIGGYGFRTDPQAYTQIARIWNDINIITVELVDDRFYHLDTCLCVLDEHTIMYYPPAFSPVSQHLLATHFNTITINEKEALQFACNAVVIDTHVIIPNNNPTTQQKLTATGYTVHEIPMDEFLKSGGAAKCLTLTL